MLLLMLIFFLFLGLFLVSFDIRYSFLIVFIQIGTIIIYLHILDIPYLLLLFEFFSILVFMLFLTSRFSYRLIII